MKTRTATTTNNTGIIIYRPRYSHRSVSLLLLSLLVIGLLAAAAAEDEEEFANTVLVAEEDNNNISSETLLGQKQAVGGGEINNGDEVKHEELLEEIEPAEYVLFPFFVEIVGVVVFYLTTYVFEHVIPLPYTAIMFLIGMFMGIAIDRTNTSNHLLKQSIIGWSNIDSELLFVTFLPGLLFWDSVNLNKYLFFKAFGQILVLAFPMVLAGTCLTAIVFYYIFPYDWSFNLAMTVGSILSATDPVAVSALLQEVGAPPRMQVHIGGESMFNDGSAMVFFTIFSQLFFKELNIPGFGEAVDLKEGFAIFFQMSLGGAAIGIAAGFVLICLLRLLDRRLSEETNIVEICTFLSVAYLTFYTSEVVSSCSGVIAVVSCGIFASSFGNGYVNDPELLGHFWGVLEHLLNTLLFCLGGVVWGRVISDPFVEDRFGGKDWGYLILLFVLLTIIRFVLIGSFYPILSRMGLRTNWQESVFSAYSGLRGAVGISLAIAIDNDVRAQTTDPATLSLTNKVFGFVGGIAFLTLVINGSTAGPLLIKLGLAKSTETRERVLRHFERSLVSQMLDEYVELLTHKEFKYAKVSLVKHYLPFFGELFTWKNVHEKLEELKSKNAAIIAAGSTPTVSREARRIITAITGTSTLPFEDVDNKEEEEEEAATPLALASHRSDGCFDGLQSVRKLDTEEGEGQPTKLKELNPLELGEMTTEDKAKEIRLIFLELLNAAYEKQKRHGYLDAREDDGFVYFVLKLSLEMARDAVSRGGKLNDWECAQSFTKNVNKVDELMSCNFQSKKTVKYQSARIALHRSVSFVYAHIWARERLEAEFIRGSNELKEAAEIVCGESVEESKQAGNFLQNIDETDKSVISAHYVCTILLNRMAGHIIKATKDGLLTEKEGQEYSDRIDKEIHRVHMCVGQDDLKEEEEEKENVEEEQEAAVVSDSEKKKDDKKEEPKEEDADAGSAKSIEDEA